MDDVAKKPPICGGDLGFRGKIRFVAGTAGRTWLCWIQVVLSANAALSFTSFIIMLPLFGVHYPHL